MTTFAKTINGIEVKLYIQDSDHCCDFCNPETGEVLAGYYDDEYPDFIEIMNTIDLIKEGEI